MSDVLAQRCAELAEPVTQLMVAAFSCHSRSPEAFDAVIEHATEVLATARLGSVGVDSNDYREWVQCAEENLEAVIEAARDRDMQRMWSAFSDPRVGLHRVGVACANEPGWASPSA